MTEQTLPDFWRESGFHLLDRADNGELAVTDDFLRAYLLRPEMQTSEESCASERKLHHALLDEPRRRIDPAELEGVSDPDARQNYTLLLAYRDRLVSHGTLERAYLSIFLEPGETPTPPIFMHQLVHVILRSILDGCQDPLELRAGELLYREQTITLEQGPVLVADTETVEMYARTGGMGSLGRLITESQTPLETVELDVIDRDNADIYWSRENQFDTVLNLSFAASGLDALCRVLEKWIRHFLGAEVSIQPIQEVREERWVWHVGLDAESSALLNDLYDGHEVDESRIARLLSLFRLEFRDPSLMLPAVAGRPVFMGLAMDEEKHLRLKPQNVLVNLPLCEQG